MVGQHSIKTISYKTPQQFIDTNGFDGTDFNKKFDRHIAREQRASLFKLIYHIMYPVDMHFTMTDKELEQISELNKNEEFKKQWQSNTDAMIKKLSKSHKSAERLLAINFRAQKDIMKEILNNPIKVYKSPSIIRTMLNGWRTKYAHYESQSENNEEIILFAQTSNVRGL